MYCIFCGAEVPSMGQNMRQQTTDAKWYAWLENEESRKSHVRAEKYKSRVR